MFKSKKLFDKFVNHWSTSGVNRVLCFTNLLYVISIFFFRKNMLSKISVFNLMKPMKYSKYFENIKTANEKEFLVENHRFSVMINGNEHLVSIKNKEMPEDKQFHLDFVRCINIFLRKRI